MHPDTLLLWLKKQVALYSNVQIENMSESFKNGLALCAIIHRYRPDLIDFHSLKPENIAANNQLAFDTLERELGIPPVRKKIRNIEAIFLMIHLPRFCHYNIMLELFEKDHRKQ